MWSLVFYFAFISCVVSTPTLRSLQDVRIVGGEDVDISEVPYQVSILRRGKHACGGAIVAADIIVTAAHCITGTSPSMYEIRAGSSYTGRGGEVYPVGDLIWHSGFDFEMMDSDIAVLWLSKPLKFSDKIAPIEMMDETENILDGEITVVTGWGQLTENGDSPTMLQRVMIPKINEEVCDEAYKPVYSITPTMMCAGIPEGGKDACQGDSGGPLAYNNKLAGIVSWGLGCARPEYPGVYAKISALRKWLDDNITYLRLRHVFRGVV